MMKNHGFWFGFRQRSCILYVFDMYFVQNTYIIRISYAFHMYLIRVGLYFTKTETDGKGAKNVVTVKIYRERNAVVAVDVCGRANMQRGGAVVESAVSAVMHSLLTGLKHLRRIVLEISEEEAAMHIRVCRGCGRSEVQTLFCAAEGGLCRLAAQYPCQVRIAQRVIYPEGVVL